AVASVQGHHPGHSRAHFTQASCSHCHSHFASGRRDGQLHPLRHSGHMMSKRVYVRMASWGPERSYEAREAQRREQAERARYAAIVAHRDQLRASNEKEAPVTAQLNLDQLRHGRDSDAAIAQWESQYGPAAKGG